jgi:acyl carrier protein
VKKKLEEIIRGVFNLKDEVIEASWTSDDILAWDSLGHLNLIMAVEKGFNVKFEIEEMFQIRSLGDIDMILEGKTGSR